MNVAWSSQIVDETQFPHIEENETAPASYCYIATSENFSETGLDLTAHLVQLLTYRKRMRQQNMC